MPKGPLWATERFRWEPDASRRIKYEQAGKDWIDDLRYLAAHPGLTFRRLQMMAHREPTGKPSLASSYVPKRGTYNPMGTPQEAIQRHMRMALRPKSRKILRRRGWSF